MKENDVSQTQDSPPPQGVSTSRQPVTTGGQPKLAVSDSPQTWIGSCLDTVQFNSNQENIKINLDLNNRSLGQKDPINLFFNATKCISG